MPDLTPDTPSVVAEAAPSKVGGDAFQRTPMVGIASGLEQLGAGLGDLAVPLAKAKAADDVAAASSDPTNPGVTRNADGTPQLPNLIFGRAGDAYQQAAKMGFQAKYSAAISQQLTDFHAAAEAKNDPQGFLQASSAYAEQIRQNNPGELGNALAAQAHNEAAQRYGNLVEKKATLDLHDDLQAAQVHVDNLTNDLTMLARKGAIGTPEYNTELTQLNASIDALGSNPRFGFTPDKLEAMKDRASGMLNGEYIAATIDQTFNRKGKAAAQDAIRTGITENQDLKIGLEDRNHLASMAMSRLSYLSAEQASALAAMKPDLERVTKKLVSGNTGDDKVSDQELSGTLAQLDQLGAIREAQELRAAATVSDRMYGVRNLPPDQRAAALLGAGGAGIGGPLASDLNTEAGAVQFFVGKGWSQAQASGIVGNLIHESGGGRLNPGAINRGDGSDGSDSIGIGQWNGQRATDLKAFAAAQGKPVNDLGVQLGFVQHELEGKEGAAAQRLRGATTAQDAAAAFALGYERPQGFQTGDIQKVLGGQNRIDQAMRLAGGGASTTAITTLGAPPYTDAEAQANPWLRPMYRQALQVSDKEQVAFAKAQFTTLENNVKFTGNPGPAIIAPAAAVLQIADAHPDNAELTASAAKLRGALDGQKAGFAAAGTPDQGQDLLSHVNDAVRAAPGSLYGLSLGEHVKAGRDAGVKLLADDHAEYARQAEWIPRAPIAFDPTQPQTWTQAMAERGTAASAVATHTLNQSVPAFTARELPAIKSMVANGTPDQQVALLSSIVNAGMPQPVLKATVAQLGGAKETQPLAAAAYVARDNPDAARNIVAGAATMREEPRLAPNSDDFPGELAKRLPFNDLGPGQARTVIDTSIRALYAKATADAGDDTTEKSPINQARLDKAIEDATGGLAKYRGSSVIGPWYGAGQAGLDAAVRTLTDADFAGAKTTDGRTFSASSLKPSFSSGFTLGQGWRLQAVGDGKYLVFTGPEEAGKRNYLHGADKQSFVLDLGAKRQQTERAGLSLATSTYDAFLRSPVAAGLQ